MFQKILARHLNLKNGENQWHHNIFSKFLANITTPNCLYRLLGFSAMDFDQTNPNMIFDCGYFIIKGLKYPIKVSAYFDGIVSIPNEENIPSKYSRKFYFFWLKYKSEKYEVYCIQLLRSFCNFYRSSFFFKKSS